MWYVAIAVVVGIGAIIAWRIYGGRAERRIQREADKARQALKDKVNKI